MVLNQIQYDIAKAQFFPGLTVIPILNGKANAPASSIKKLFGEAIDNGDIKILESGSVPQLNVQVISGESILGIKGTLFVGGGQDRQLRHSCIITEGNFRIPVQCVEQGRWNPRRNKKFESANSITSPTLRSRSTDQGNVWQTISRYENISTTRSSTESYTCSSTLSVGTDKEVEEITRKYNVKMNKDMADMRKRALEMSSALAQPVSGQIGVLVVQIDPLKWQKTSHTQDFQVHYLIEIVNDSIIWNKLHRKVIEGVIYDTALLKIAGVPNLQIGSERKKKIQQFLRQLNQDNWKKVKSIGIESRTEFNCSKSKIYAEAIYRKQCEMPVHLVATSSTTENFQTDVQSQGEEEEEQCETATPKVKKNWSRWLRKK